jgi:hypothetical protein
MGIFYSPATHGFYDTQINAETIPGDAVGITQTEHQALLAAQSAGRQITPGAQGRPVAVDREPAVVSITSVTRRQAQLQMLRMTKDGNNVLDMVEAAVETAGRAAQVEWRTAATIDRDNPLYLQIKALLGFSDEDEDTFFTQASQIT